MLERAAAQFDMRFEIFTEVLQCTGQRLDCAGGVQTECVAGRANEARIALQHFEICGSTAPLFNVDQQPLQPRQPVATRRAEATGLLGKEVLQVARQIDDAHRVINDDHGACTHPAAGLLNGGVFHWQVEMLFDQEVC